MKKLVTLGSLLAALVASAPAATIVLVSDERRSIGITDSWEFPVPGTVQAGSVQQAELVVTPIGGTESFLRPNPQRFTLDLWMGGNYLGTPESLEPNQELRLDPLNSSRLVIELVRGDFEIGQAARRGEKPQYLFLCA